MDLRFMVHLFLLLFLCCFVFWGVGLMGYGFGMV